MYKNIMNAFRRQSQVNQIVINDIEAQDGSGSDIFVELKNGRVIRISPEFNSISVFFDKQKILDSSSIEYEHCVNIEVDMGGHAAGEYEERDNKKFIVSDYTD